MAMYHHPRVRAWFAILAFLFASFGCKKTGVVQEPAPSPPVFGKLVFQGAAFQNNGTYPKLHTCDSSGISPALNWSAVPAGVKGYAVTMHHYPPTGDKHVYWVLYNIPPDVTSIPQGLSGTYSFGINTVDRKNTYAPPCSQGPGPKAYILTLYALQAQPVISKPAPQVTMDVLLDAIRSAKLDTAVMNVTYTR